MFREYDPRKRKWRDKITGSYYDNQFGGFPIAIAESIDYSVIDSTPAPVHTPEPVHHVHVPDTHHHVDTSSSFDFGHHSF